MRIYCIRCKQLTNHGIVTEHKREYTPKDHPEMQIDWAKGTWQILKCEGCDAVSFRESWVTSEDFDPETGEPLESVKLYPLRGADALSAKYFYEVPQKLRKIYDEVVACYNAGQNILCAAGLRALIEGICANMQIKDGPVVIKYKDGTEETVRKANLEGKIAGLLEKGIITKNNAGVLHEHRVLGNEALHELSSPSSEELRLAFEIMEHTLENIYELGQKHVILKYKRIRRKEE